jgi:hypothetical protein
MKKPYQRKTKQESEQDAHVDPNAGGRSLRINKNTTIVFAHKRAKTKAEFNERVERWKQLAAQPNLHGPY